MAVDNFDSIDAIGTNTDGELVLMIADHLDWEDEEYHLLVLQKKLNLYIDFIQNKEYKQYYSQEFSQIVFDIHFKFGWTNNCKKFLNYVVEMTKRLNIVVRIETESGQC